MALKDTMKKMHAALEELSEDLKKAETGNQAASQRVRTGTIKFAKLSKQYRKESMTSEKGAKKKKAKKKATRRKAPRKKTKTTRRKKGR